MENTFRDVNIALANEFSLIADKFRFDISATIELANKHPRVNILQPGIGVGGHCIAIDPWFLTEDIDGLNVIRAARELNDEMPKHTAGRIQNKIAPSVRRIGILGVSYKPDVDDARETPALEVARLLSERYEIRCHDPFVKAWEFELFPLEEVDGWADALVVLSNHKIYGSKQFRSPLLSFDDLINAKRRELELKQHHGASDLKLASVVPRSSDSLPDAGQAPTPVLPDHDLPPKMVEQI